MVFSITDRNVEHLSCGAASPGSSPQSGCKSQFLQWNLPIGAYYKKLVLFVCAGQSGYCSRLTTVTRSLCERRSVGLLFPANYSRGNIKNGRLAIVQDPCDPKNRGWANPPAFSFPNEIFFSCKNNYTFCENIWMRKKNYIKFRTQFTSRSLIFQEFTKILSKFDSWLFSGHFPFCSTNTSIYWLMLIFRQILQEIHILQFCLLRIHMIWWNKF